MTINRWCFNITLLLAGIFGLAAGGSPNFIALASLIALVGVGVGGTLKCKTLHLILTRGTGNLPVDSAVFLGLFYLSTNFTSLD